VDSLFLCPPTFPPPPQKNEKTQVLPMDRRAALLYGVACNPKSIKYFSDEWKDDMEMVLVAVRSDGRCLKYASKRLRCVRLVVEAAVSDYGPALEWASTELKNDPALVSLSRM